jgi:signal transduction histidine kinase
VGDQPESPTRDDHLAGSLAAGVLILDSRGTVRLANARARALLGGRGVEFGDPGAVSAVVAAAADAPENGWKEITVVVAGEPRALGVQATPLGGGGAPSGKPGDVLLMLADLTEARAAGVDERWVATLAGIGRLTHHVAHELKNPLGALKLYTLLLERQLRDAKPDSRDLAEKIGRAIDHLTSVVTEVTAFGPAGTLEREAVAVGALLDESLAAVAERAAAAGVEVVRRDEPGIAVRGDARTLRQALRAFIDNAVDAMPRGGTLTVSLTREDGRTVGITVADSGPGLSLVAQARLFEPFFTTKPDKVGLGATIAGHIVEQHGGRIVVRSEPKVGTTIRIALPAD